MFTLPKLPYNYDALTPHIDEKTMELHYSKHHQTYVDKLNSTLVNYPQLLEKPIADLLKDLNNIPEDIRTSVNNFGGGHYNHSFFWEILNPDKQIPSDPFLKLISPYFGSFDQFQTAFNNAALNHFGSGWVWLVVDSNSALSITTTTNQDSPISKGLTPLLTLDLWEHAYYLNYQNRRADYIKAFWNIINYQKVVENSHA